MEVNIGSFSNSLPIGSKKRLVRFQQNLTKDRVGVIFDDKLVDVAMEYVKDPSRLISVRRMLNDLKSEDGEPFCQSIYHYSKLQQQINGFIGPSHTSFRWNVHYQAAVKFLKKEFSQLRLKALDYYCDGDIISNLPKLTTHSGWTYIETGFKKKGDNMEGIYSRLLEAEKEAFSSGTFNRPILPGIRIQGSAFDEEGNLLDFAKLKNRVVNMVDLLVICSELRTAKPLQEWMSRWSFYAGGKSASEISTIIMNDRKKYPYFLSLDYSAYDQTLSDWLIEDAFGIVRCAFCDVPEAYWAAIIHDFIYKDMITADGVLHIERGVPSGSMFTQIIDSICNVLMIQTYLYSIQSDGHMLVMGDDNLLFSDQFIDSEVIASYVSKNFGVKVNASKTSGGTRNDYPRFLSREWRGNGQWRHPNVIMSKLMFPERFRKYDNVVTPELVFYAYYLTYPLGMLELFDIRQFFEDHPNLNAIQSLDKVDSRYIPGALSFAKEYLGMQ